MDGNNEPKLFVPPVPTHTSGSFKERHARPMGMGYSVAVRASGVNFFKTFIVPTT